jgi:hypothetical protein
VPIRLTVWPLRNSRKFRCRLRIRNGLIEVGGVAVVTVG